MRIVPGWGICVLALGIGFAPAQHAGAADWAPTEKIVFVTHAPPGASIDVFLRTAADIWTRHKLAPRPVVIDNVMGAGGDRARRLVAVQSRGNNHMLFGYTPQMMITPIRAGSDINVKSYTPVALMVLEPTVMFVNADTPYKSVRDLLDAARQKPKGVLQGGGAFGGPPSLMGKMMGDEAKVEFAYTPFKTSAEAVVALLGKHVQFVMEQPSEADQHVKAGRLRVVATSVPLEQYPNVPTFESLGMKFRLLKHFRGVVAPPGIAPEVVEFYVRTLDRMRATPEWKQYLKQYEVVEHWVVGRALADWLEDEEKTYVRLNKELGLLK
jgi:putative tricarboxylic transport membrane protein